MHYLIASMNPVLLVWSYYVSNPIVPEQNRPRIFRGMLGKWFFILLIAIILLSQVDGLIWGFETFQWWIALALLCLGVFLGDSSYRYLPPASAGSARALLCIVGVLIVLNFAAWDFLAP